MNRFYALFLGLLLVLSGHETQARIDEITSIRNLDLLVDACLECNSLKASARLMQGDVDKTSVNVAASIDGIVVQDNKEAKESAPKPTVWVLFDLDNTLVQPANEARVCSDQWFGAVFGVARSKGLSRDEVLKYFLPIHFGLQAKVNLELIEEGVAPGVIANLQELPGVAVMGLTARSLPLCDITAVGLRGLGIDFSKGALCGEDYLYDLAYPAGFYRGILFCGENDKGDMLFRLAESLGCLPKLIIFVDDKHKNLEVVEVAALNKGCQFIGLRYGRLDEAVKAFTLGADWQAWVEELHQKLYPSPSRQSVAGCKVA